jgi:hypothetical protein
MVRGKIPFTTFALFMSQCEFLYIISGTASLVLFLDIVLFPEPFDASGGVYEFLLAGEEGVAGRADLNFDVLCCGTGFYNVPAGAGDLGHFVLGMNSFFHLILQKIVQLRRF